MATLTLNFENELPAFLDRTCFIRGDSVSECMRGKSSIKRIGSFPWSPAVRAVAELVVKTAYVSLTTPESFVKEASLRGGAGTSAASLDYAISKRPEWLADMFGTDQDGRCFASRVFLRRNSNRKRGGLVDVWLNSAILDPNSIKIYWKNQQILDPNALLLLLSSVSESMLESSPPSHRIRKMAMTSKHFSLGESIPHSQVCGLSHPIAVTERTRPTFSHAYETAVVSEIRQFDIFSPEQTNKVIRQFTVHPLFRRQARKNWRSDFQIDSTKLTSLAIEGPHYASNRLLSRPFSIAYCPGAASISLVLERLRRNYRLNLKAQHSFSKAGTIIEQCYDGLFDIACVPFSLCHLLLGRKGSPYRAVGILPSSSTEILRPAHAKSLVKKEDAVFEYPCHVASTGDWVLDHYFSKFSGASDTAHKSSVSMLDQLQRMKECDENSRFVSWFPYSHWAKDSLGASTCIGSTDMPSFQLIFARKSIPQAIQRELLGLTYRALAEIYHLSHVRRDCLKSVLSDDRYIGTLTQLAGINGRLELDLRGASLDRTSFSSPPTYLNSASPD